MGAKNKVKYNLCNVHFALLTEGTNGEVTWEKPEPIPGAVSLNMEPTGEPESFYADGVEYYVINNNQGYDGDLEIALIPESFRTKVLNETSDASNVLVENANAQAGHFALLFEFDGDVKKVKHVMYNCSSARPTIASKTNEDKREIQTEKLTIKSRPLASGLVKAKTGDSTKATAYNNWYKNVYVPDLSGSTSEEPEDESEPTNP